MMMTTQAVASVMTRANRRPEDSWSPRMRVTKESRSGKRRPVQINVWVGAEGKIVLDGNEVQMDGAELVEGVGHGHATGARPALIVAVEAEMEEPGVESDDCKCGDYQPECGGLEEIRTLGGFNSGIQTTISGR